MAKVAPEEHLPEDVGHVVVHATVHKDLGSHHNEARETKLKDCTDEQILSELARRGVDVKHQITEESVKETYKFEKFLGEGASGQVHLVKHKKSGHSYACKVIKKDGKVGSWEGGGGVNHRDSGTVFLTPRSLPSHFRGL